VTTQRKRPPCSRCKNAQACKPGLLCRACHGADDKMAKSKSKEAPKPTARVETVRLDLIRTEGLQLRAKVSEEAIADYAEVYASTPDEMPPGHAVKDERGLYHLWDGHHRLAGAKRAGLTEVRLSVTDGTAEDALWLAASANKTNAVRRTNECKGNSVRAALKMHTERSDGWIAKHVGVTQHTVYNVRQEMLSGQKISDLDYRIGKDGKRYENVETYAQKQAKLAPQPTLRPHQAEAVKSLNEALSDEEATDALNGPAPEDRLTDEGMAELEARAEANRSGEPDIAEGVDEALGVEGEGFASPAASNPDGLAGPDAEAEWPKDGIGLPIPPELRLAFENRKLFAEAIAYFRKGQKVIHDLAMSRGGEIYRRHLKAVGTIDADERTFSSHDVAAAIHALKSAMPHVAVCVHCRETVKPTCPICVGAGFVTKDTWERTLDETKAKAVLVATRRAKACRSS
jgi:hypothetical protein